MAVISILNAAMHDGCTLSVHPEICKRVRFRKSNCQRCVEICPENAISTSPGPILNKGCSDCGLCERVCPTEAFQSHVYNDLSLLNQAKSLPEKKRLVIHCHRAEGESPSSLSLSCLGKVSENFILGVALLGFDEVLLIHGACAKCRFQKGMKLLTESIMTSRVLLEGLGVGKFHISLKEQAKGREKILSRREIFSKVSNEIKKKASSYFRHEEGAFRKRLPGISGGKDGKMGSPRRRLLRTLIKHKGLEKSVVLKCRPESPWGKIRIDEKNCSACGTCITLCPTGSISNKLEDGAQLFYVNSSLCTHCSLCKEACPRNAIDFEVNFPLSDILEDESKVAARVKLTPCIACGEMVPVEKGNLCFTCEKRRVWPMQPSL